MLICDHSYGEMGGKGVMVEKCRAPASRRMEMRSDGGNRVRLRSIHGTTVPLTWWVVLTSVWERTGFRRNV